MNSRSLIAALALAPGLSVAGTQVFRCESADGVPTYSDQSCASLGAVEVLPALSVDGGSGAVTATPVRRAAGGSMAAMCPARSAADLPGAVGRAFATGDVNDLASLYHWPGLSTGDARRMFGKFQSLLAQPLRHVGFSQQGGPLAVADSTQAPAAHAQAAIVGSELWLELGPAQAPTTVQFDVIENAGCVWLRFG